jgi:SAM-dependent methyltransferase
LDGLVISTASIAAEGLAAGLADELERPPCPLCRSPRAQPTAYRHAAHAVVRCDDCRLFYLSPRLAEASMRRHYEAADYFEGGACGYDSYARQEASLRLTFRKVTRALERAGLAGGSLLEVGAGYGFFLDEAKDRFTRREATELSPPAAARAAAHADALWPGGIEAVPAGRLYDLVVSFHVIEHVYAPAAFVAALVSLVRPGGHLVLATPDMGGAWRRLLGRRWPSFKWPEHVTFFDRATLGRLMLEAGLADLRPVAYPHAFPLGDLAAKLGFRAPRRFAGLPLPIPGTTLALAGRRPA